MNRAHNSMANGLKKSNRILPAKLLARGMAVIFVLAACGCCCTQFQAEPSGPAAFLKVEKLDFGWWYASFNVRWPEGQAPAMFTDLLLAHRIAAPVVNEFKKEIPLWRFHRRAARDEVGHRFSLILYCTPETARRAFAAVDSSALLGEMKAAGVIEKVILNETDKILKWGVAGVSDRSWSLPVEKAWPWFIMGVSETWLNLIDLYANDGRPKPRTLDETLEFYREVDKSVRGAWCKEGGHAFLHHLNAVFGYEPVMIRKTPMAF